MATVDTLVDRLVSQFEVTSTVALGFLNDRQARMLAEAEFLTATVTLGTTTAGTANYTLASTVTDLKKVRVVESDGSFTQYELVAIEDLWDLDAAEAQVSLSDGGLCALDYTAAGAVQLRLYPEPETTGLTISGIVALAATAATYGGGTALQVPVDMETHLYAGMQADAYDREDRQDMAAKAEVRFTEGVGKLVKRKNTRGDGNGPHRMRVSGYDYR
jgi:hypothetical protein